MADEKKSPEEDLALSDEDLEAVAGGNLTAGNTSEGTNAGWTGTDQPVNCCGEGGCFPKPTTNIYCRIGQTITGECGSSSGGGTDSFSR